MPPSVRDYLDAVTSDDEYHVYWPEMYVAATCRPQDTRAVYHALGALCTHDGIRKHLAETVFVVLGLDGGFDPDSDDDPRTDELYALLHAAVGLDDRRPELLQRLRAAIQQCDAFDTCADHAKHCLPACAERHPHHIHPGVAAGGTDRAKYLPPI